jgi:hypothetical protein
VPRQVPRGTPEPRGWVAFKFPTFVSERSVLATLDLWLAPREAPACGLDEADNVIWMPREDAQHRTRRLRAAKFLMHEMNGALTQLSMVRQRRENEIPRMGR